MLQANPAVEDLTDMSNSNTLLLMITIGEALHGRAWKRGLAQDLGPYMPSGPQATLSERSMHRWVAGERPVPGWVAEALPKVLEAAATEAGARASRLRKLSDSLFTI